jgi:hypothetical protein
VIIRDSVSISNIFNRARFFSKCDVKGASSFDSLVLTGRPHIRCRGDDRAAWEIGYDLVHDENLKVRLQKFYIGGFCQSMDTWINNSNIYQTLGELIIEANDPNSPFSRYFQDRKREAAKPENDRIRLGLEKAMKNAHTI